MARRFAAYQEVEIFPWQGLESAHLQKLAKRAEYVKAFSIFLFDRNKSYLKEWSEVLLKPNVKLRDKTSEKTQLKMVKTLLP